MAEVRAEVGRKSAEVGGDIIPPYPQAACFRFRPASAGISGHAKDGSRTHD